MNNSMVSVDSFAKAIEAMRDALEESKSAMSATLVNSSEEFLSKAEAKLAAFGNSKEVRKRNSNSLCFLFSTQSFFFC